MKSLFKSLYLTCHGTALWCVFIQGLLLVSACTPTAMEQATQGQRVLPTQEQAGWTQSLSEASQQQSRPFSFEQSQQHLHKIESFIRSGDNLAAKKVADAINPLKLPVAQQAQFNLFYAQILLGIGDAETALKWLAGSLPERLDLQHQIEYFQAQAFAFSITGNPLDSAKARIALHELLASPEQREENQSAILESLTLLPDSVLENSESPAADPLTGWLSLAKLLKTKGQPGFNERAAQWRDLFPGHPANAAFLDDIQETPGIESQPASIALFLPESGPFAGAGKAIRAGFMAAYNDQGNQGDKPGIHFYDSERASPLFLYNQAITDGADFIIGPLQKEAIQSLAGSVTLQVPVLALNHVPGLEKDNLYQFGLSPIDDVEEITHKAWLDNHRKALLLIPDNAQGKRIVNYFTDSWQGLGGVILETQTFKPKETDFSETLKKLLNLDESEYRYNKILELIPKLKYNPRRRQDADVLLLNANSAEARSINPQLHYYQASQLPVYATPGVYSGQTNASLDSDLDQITFCDTPWLLDKTYLGTLSMDTLQDTWQSFPDSYLRLFAMGIDTYRLLGRLKTLDISACAGATGKLSLVTENRIKRSLACARFTDGLPKVIDPIDSTAESFGKTGSDPKAATNFQSRQDHLLIEQVTE